MLAIERGHDLAGIQIGKGEHLHFRETELLFSLLHNVPSLRFVHTATQNRGDFNFDLHQVWRSHHQFVGGPLRGGS